MESIANWNRCVFYNTGAEPTCDNQQTVAVAFTNAGIDDSQIQTIVDEVNISIQNAAENDGKADDIPVIFSWFGTDGRVRMVCMPFIPESTCNRLLDEEKELIACGLFRIACKLH